MTHIQRPLGTTRLERALAFLGLKGRRARMRKGLDHKPVGIGDFEQLIPTGLRPWHWRSEPEIQLEHELRGVDLLLKLDVPFDDRFVEAHGGREEPMRKLIRRMF